MSSIDPGPYSRVLLKLSGESFARPGERGIAMDEVVHIAKQTVQAVSRGVQLAVVIGGGNILRGALSRLAMHRFKRQPRIRWACWRL